jgi:hypothetical protein
MVLHPYADAIAMRGGGMMDDVMNLVRTLDDVVDNAHLDMDEALSLYEYSESSSYAVNAYLCGEDTLMCRTAKSIISRPHAEDIIRDIDGALDKVVVPMPVRVYRSELLDDGDNEYSRVRACLHGLYVKKSYASTSVVRDDACRYVIDVPAGFHAISMHGISAHGDEYEVLLPRDIAYEVDEIDGDGVLHMVPVDNASIAYFDSQPDLLVSRVGSRNKGF